MSKSFLANDALSPFRQADPHSNGTGLGLSIVKEVAKEFKGSLSIESDLGSGSRVSICFTTTFTEPASALMDGFDSRSPLSEISHLHMLPLSHHLGCSLDPSISGVADSIQRTASQWLGCEVSSSQAMGPGPRGAICVVSEAELSILNTKAENAVRKLVEGLARENSRLLIFGPSLASCWPNFDFKDFAFKPLYIHQP